MITLWLRWAFLATVLSLVAYLVVYEALFKANEALWQTYDAFSPVAAPVRPTPTMSPAVKQLVDRLRPVSTPGPLRAYIDEQRAAQQQRQAEIEAQRRRVTMPPPRLFGHMRFSTPLGAYVRRQYETAQALALWDKGLEVLTTVLAVITAGLGYLWLLRRSSGQKRRAEPGIEGADKPSSA